MWEHGAIEQSQQNLLQNIYWTLLCLMFGDVCCVFPWITDTNKRQCRNISSADTTVLNCRRYSLLIFRKCSCGGMLKALKNMYSGKSGNAQEEEEDVGMLVY